MVVVVVESGGTEVAGSPVVVVVSGASSSSGGTSASTGRNRSSAVRPTMRWALSRSLTPGRFTTMLSPSRVTSASATPRASTRLRMMSTATSSEPSSGSPTGTRRTEMPPCRSSPSTGVLPEMIVAARAPSTTTNTVTR